MASNSLIKSFIKYSTSGLSNIFLFALLVIAGRYLGSEDFGRFSFALALTLLLSPVIDPGMYHFLIREIAQDRSRMNELIAHSLGWKVLISPIWFILIMATTWIIGCDSLTQQVVFMISVATLIKSFKEPYRTILVSHEHFGLDSISLIFERGILLVASIVLFLTGKGLITFCWAFIITRMIDLIVIIVMAFTQVGRVGIAFNLTKIKTILFSSLPIGAFYMTLYFYNYTDTVMLANWRGPAEIGWYNAAYRIYEGFLIIPALLGTVFLPRLSRYHVENGESFPILLSAGIKATTVLAGFIMLNGLLFSDKLILWLFGNEYTASTIALDILLMGIIPVFCTTFMQILLIAMKEQKNLLRLSLSGLVLNVVLNVWLIPQYFYIGAARATLISEVFVFSGYIFFLSKFITGFKVKAVFGKMFLIIALLMILVFLVHSVPFVLRIALCNILLVFGIYVFRVFTLAERKILLQ